MLNDPKWAVKCKQLHVLHILAIDIQQQNEGAEASLKVDGQ